MPRVAHLARTKRRPRPHPGSKQVSSSGSLKAGREEGRFSSGPSVMGQRREVKWSPEAGIPEVHQ